MSLKWGRGPPDVNGMSRERILIVDDRPSIHDDFHKILAPSGHERAPDLDALEAELFGTPTSAPPAPARGFTLDDAMQGAEAIELARGAIERGDPYGVVFLDVRMPPGIDGVVTAGHLFELDPDVQIVLCTAYSDYSWQETVDALERHADNFLVLKKPFDPIEARMFARVLMDKRRLARAATERRRALAEAVRVKTQRHRRAKEALAREIVERERIEHELVDARRQEATGQLAAGIAHEINTPVQFIGDHLAFLGDGLGELRAHLAFAEELLKAQGAVTPPLAAALERADLEYLTEGIPEAVQRGDEGLAAIARLVRALKELAHPGAEDASLARAVELVHTLCRGQLAERFDVSLRATEPGPPYADCPQSAVNAMVAGAFDCVARSGDDRAGGAVEITVASDDDTCRADFCVPRAPDWDAARLTSLRRRVERGGGQLGCDGHTLTLRLPRKSRGAGR